MYIGLLHVVFEGSRPLTAGSMREYLPSSEALNDDSSKQRIRKHPKARKSSLEEIVGEPKSAWESSSRMKDEAF